MASLVNVESYLKQLILAKIRENILLLISNVVSYYHNSTSVHKLG